MAKKVKRNCDVGKADRRTITLLRELLCARVLYFFSFQVLLYLLTSVILFSDFFLGVANRALLDCACTT